MTEPCATDEPGRPKLFYCHWAGRGDNVTLGPFEAFSEVHTLGELALGVRVKMDCPIPPLSDIFRISAYQGEGEAPTTLAIFHMGPPSSKAAALVPFSGLTAGDVVSFSGLPMPPSPATPPPPPLPTAPPSPSALNTNVFAKVDSWDCACPEIKSGGQTFGSRYDGINGNPSGYDLDATDIEDCKSLCARSPGCSAFIHIPSSNKCYFRGGPDTVQPSPACLVFDEASNGPLPGGKTLNEWTSGNRNCYMRYSPPPRRTYSTGVKSSNGESSNPLANIFDSSMSSYGQVNTGGTITITFDPPLTDVYVVEVYQPFTTSPDKYKWSLEGADPVEGALSQYNGWINLPLPKDGAPPARILPAQKRCPHARRIPAWRWSCSQA